MTYCVAQFGNTTSPFSGWNHWRARFAERVRDAGPASVRLSSAGDEVLPVELRRSS